MPGGVPLFLRLLQFYGVPERGLCPVILLPYELRFLEPPPPKFSWNGLFLRKATPSPSSSFLEKSLPLEGPLHGLEIFPHTFVYLFTYVIDNVYA